MLLPLRAIRFQVHSAFASEAIRARVSLEREVPSRHGSRRQIVGTTLDQMARNLVPVRDFAKFRLFRFAT